MTVLMDNTVMSNFAIIQRPDLLREAWIEGVATTEEAFQELQKGVEIGRLPVTDWSWLKRIILNSTECRSYQRFIESLGKGEASCLAVAVERKYKIATDDKDARNWASRLKVPFAPF